MEEIPLLISKKRKRTSSSTLNPFTGTFTRSKSQIYLHCNRSGQARSDSFRLSEHHINLRSNPVGFRSKKTQFKSNKKTPVATTFTDQEPSTGTDDWSSFIIKDLRTRRVFSLADNGCRLCDDDSEENKEFEKGGSGLEDVLLLFDSKKVEEKEDVIVESNVGYCSKQQLNSTINEAGNLINEECNVRATPPDAEIVRLNDINMESVSVKLSAGNLGRSEGVQDNNNMDKNDGNHSAPKSGLNPWSRVRVFKAPGSLSYRRLLPYLMDMVQDHSCSPKKGNFPTIQSQQLSADKLQTIDSLTKDDTDSNLIVTECITDSSMLFGSQKENFKSVDSPTSLVDQCCPKSSADDANEKIIMRASCEDKNLESSSLIDNHTINQDSGDTKALDSGEIKEVINSSCDAQSADEESMQMTPPDADICGKTMAYQNADNRIKFVPQNANQVVGKPLNGSTNGNDSYFSDKRTDSSSKSKSGLKPCSQLKLLKTSGSFNYKRMLPYLMDVAKDNSGDSRNGKCPKLESSQENLLSSSAVSDPKETPVEILNGSSHFEHDTDSCSLKMSPLPGSNQSNTILSDHKIDLPGSVGSREEQEPQVMMNASDDKDRLSDKDPGSVNLVNGSCSVTKPTFSSLACPQPVSGDFYDLVSQELSTNNEEDCRTSLVQHTNAAKPVEGGSIFQNSSKLEVSDSLGIPANGLTKSILKRHPRGCRGVCNCLNCASFRLHAERAFEFSKNQMKDAEEVALDLIEELSSVRNLLEKAASDSNNHLIICNNQVKEACSKSFEAEELARNRLSQMNYDLNIHCRISGGERPRVRFSNSIEERIFHG